MELVPPFRFGVVEDRVYRGAYPVLHNFNFLRRLKLRTILSLTPESATYDLRAFATAENIGLKYIQTEKFKGDSVSLLPPEISDALHAIVNVDLHPIYVHCLDGRHVVGTVIMALRKLQMWDSGCSHQEYLRYVRERNDEVAFVMDYGGPLTIPEKIPLWLWSGTVTDADSGKPKKHPSIKCKVAGSAGAASLNIKSSLDPENDDLLDTEASPAESSSASPTTTTTFFDVHRVDQLFENAEATVALSLRVSLQTPLPQVPSPVVPQSKRRKRSSSASQ
jgi:hypothetical protein